MTRILERFDARVARYSPFTRPLLRGGLGGTILLAGGHKLVAPSVWHAYLAPPFVARWPMGVLPLDPIFVLFGVSELLVGLLLLADWHTPTVAAITAISLLGVVVNLSVGVLVGEPYVDVLIRDVGLMLLAFGVALHSTTSREGGVE